MARLSGECDVTHAGSVVAQFCDLYGRAKIASAVEKVRDETRRRSIISSAWLRRFAIPLGLHKLIHYNKSTGRQPDLSLNSDLFPALAFAATAVEMHQLLDDAGRKRIAGEIKDSLSLVGDARRLQHEFTVAAHLSHRGCELDFADLIGGGRFDYLTSKDRLEVEVECKTISADAGNPIHIRDALNFFEETIDIYLAKARAGCWTIDLTFPGRLPTQRSEQAALAEVVASRMQVDCGFTAGNDVAVRIRQWKMPPTNDIATTAKFAATVNSKLQSRLNGHSGTVFNQDRLLTLCVSSNQDVRPLDHSYDVINGACKQLTGNRAGLVWVHFVDLSDSEIYALAAPERGILGSLAARIFPRDDRKHLSALSLSGEGQMASLSERLGNIRQTSHVQRGYLPTVFNSKATHPLTGSGIP